jgi:AraC family transcriptional regulator
MTDPRIDLAIAVRRSPGGDVRHPAGSDHYLSVLAGAPVRVSCHSGKQRSLRTRGEIYLFPAGIEPRHHLRDRQIEHITFALEAEHRAGYPGGLLYRESLGMALAVHLLARYRGAAVPRAGLSRGQLERVRAHIEAHVAEDLSLLRLAGVAGVGVSHCRALFKRSTGLTVHAYVIQRRVQRARALLVAGELPASEVAVVAGFAHQSHMARCMRRVLGVRPALVARGR